MSGHKQKILIVDDEPDMRKIINDVLTEAGYDTYLAENGAHALELASAISPDLILSDIQMPSMNGYELLNTVKVDPELGKVPFVFMTGVNVGRFDLRKGMDLGADDYLTKPFSVEDLIHAVEVRLRKQQLWKAFTDSKLTKTQTGFIVLLSNELQILVMDILEHAQSLLAGKDIAPSDVETAALMITRSGKRLSHLHENILYYSMLQIWVKDRETIEEMRKEVTTSYLSVLHSILHENVRMKMRTDALTVNCTDTALQISPADFGKIVDEVLDNACKFSEANSPVTITSSQDDLMLSLTIRDNGRGMTNEEIAQSASFFGNDQSIQRKTEGGVGLTIAATITELYGGRLSVESTLHKGTTVTISFPRAAVS
ncbi:MAG: response regulator [Bacteriovoracaceae bacterium]|nr:response regulator [Bacteroidota bacterium]